MGHVYPIREIALQAGLSEATVDRVLNERGGVRASTVNTVHQAIAHLDNQRTQLRLTGRTFMIDLVMQAPERFTDAVKGALEAELPSLQPAVMRCRFHLREQGSVQSLTDVLDDIARRGSNGVILKAPDLAEINLGVARLRDAGIPVITLVTDLPDSGRVAYVGIDNRRAGATAAYLVDQWMGSRQGDILVTLSNSFFRGEEEREMGFRAALRTLRPGSAVVEISDTAGLDSTMHALARAALKRNPGIRAVYSVGGANVAMLAAFDDERRPCAVYIAHDLDADNIRLLRTGRLSAVLHHELRHDMRQAGLLIMHANEALPGPIRNERSTIQIITPYNLPVTDSGSRSTQKRDAVDADSS